MGDSDSSVIVTLLLVIFVILIVLVWLYYECSLTNAPPIVQRLLKVINPDWSCDKDVKGDKGDKGGGGKTCEAQIFNDANIGNSKGLTKKPEFKTPEDCCTGCGKDSSCISAQVEDSSNCYFLTDKNYKDWSGKFPYKDTYSKGSNCGQETFYWYEDTFKQLQPNGPLSKAWKESVAGQYCGR